MYKDFNITEDEYEWFIQQTAFGLVQMMYQNDEELVDNVGEADFWYGLITNDNGRTTRTFIEWLTKASSLFYFAEYNETQELTDWLAPKNRDKYSNLFDIIMGEDNEYPDVVKNDLIKILKEPMKEYLRKALEEHPLSQFADEENKIAYNRVKSWVN